MDFLHTIAHLVLLGWNHATAICVYFLGARTMKRSQFCLNLEVGGRMRWFFHRLRAMAASTCTSDWDSDDFEDTLSIEPVASVSAIFSPPEQPVSQPWQGGLTSLAGRKVAALPRWQRRESGKENAAAKATVLLGFAPVPSVGSGKARLRGLRERARNGEAW